MVEFPFNKITRIDLTGKKFLIPNMHPYATRLVSACLRGFGSNAMVLPTYRDLNLGKQFTSGKECFPCQVTISDILHFLIEERKKLKDKFNPKDYVYLMPEADGPCRFGMYNKFQRIVLNSFEDFKDVYISYFTSEDSYSTKGVLPEEKATNFKKMGFFLMCVADILDRIVWRVRPYEKIKGKTEELIEEKMIEMEKVLEKRAEELPFKTILKILEDTAIKAKDLINFEIERKPRIGIVGEIFLRSHPPSNQYIINKIEEYGGEVVNASLCEWMNFVTYENIRKTKLFLRVLKREKMYKYLISTIKKLMALKIEQEYQRFIIKRAYSTVLNHLDIQPDHDVVELEKHLEDNKIYSYEVGTEACLSIAGALAYIKDGFNGVVNVYPFTCMASTITSAILRSILKSRKIPYLDASYDGTIQPNREIAIKTFMFQASQHKKIYFS